MLLNTYPKLIEKILCRCGVIQDLQKILNNPTRDSRENFTHEISAISEDQSNMRRHASGLRKSIPVCQLICCYFAV